MKLGFFTLCMADRPLEDIARWAATNGFEALEVAAWPSAGGGADGPAHVAVEQFDQARADEVLALFDRHDLTVSSLGFYNNNLDPRPDERRSNHDHLLRCIDAAALLGCPTVGTFIGRDPNRTVELNMVEAREVFAPIVEHAHQRDVKIVIENCVMHGWHDDGYPGNLAYSPELWEWMFDLGLHLNFDPSHLMWLGIDPVWAVQRYADHIAHVQAKDVEILPSERNRFGIYGSVSDRPNRWDTGWWRYRVPGLGQVDWIRLIDALYEHGYDGAVSVEHEDPVWDGSPDRVEAGLERAHRTLGPLIVR